MSQPCLRAGRRAVRVPAPRSDHLQAGWGRLMMEVTMVSAVRVGGDVSDEERSTLRRRGEAPEAAQGRGCAEVVDGDFRKHPSSSRVALLTGASSMRRLASPAQTARLRPSRPGCQRSLPGEVPPLKLAAGEVHATRRRSRPSVSPLPCARRRRAAPTSHGDDRLLQTWTELLRLTRA